MCKGSGKSLLFKDCGCGCNGKKQEEKFMASLMAGAVFFLVANPEVYRVTRKLIGNWVATPTGCASTKGLLLHAVVFFLITWALMNVQGIKLRREMADGETAIEPTEGETEGETETETETEVEEAPVSQEEVEDSEGEFASFKNGQGASISDPESAHLANVAVKGSGMLGMPNENATYQQCKCADGSSVNLMMA